MALVKYGGGIIQMAGKIAGNVFAKNKSGNYVRGWSKPVNPNTARQQNVRAAVAQLADRWAQTLTAPQRAAWNLYASNVSMKNRLGEAIKLSGFNHYIRSNSLMAAFNKDLVDDGPAVFELPAHDPLFRITASEATQQITLIFDDTMDWCSEDNARLWGFAGIPQNPQRNFFAGPWRYVFSQAGNAGAPTTSPQISAPGWAITEGQHLWYYARIFRADGRLSEVFRDDTFCGA